MNTRPPATRLTEHNEHIDAQLDERNKEGYPLGLKQAAQACDYHRDQPNEYCNQCREKESAKDGPEGPASEPAPEITDFSQGNSMLQKIVNFALGMIAPPQTLGPQDMRRYWLTSSIAIVILYGLMMIDHGYGARFGLPAGFARADTVTAIQSDLLDLRVQAYASAIRDLYRSKCNAMDYDDVRMLEGKIQEVQIKYQALVHVPYLLPACPERKG